MAPPIDKTLFDDDFLRRLQGLALLARQLARQQNLAQRRSSQRGANVEFAEYRPFQPGDDWKHIDWNAYARWRTLVLKLYVEEKDLPVHLLLDNSLSMDWGEPRKFDQARRLAAGLAYLALDRHDRTSLVPLAGSDSAGLGTVRGMGRFYGILGQLSALQTNDPGRGLEEMTDHWLRRRPETGITIVLSDLWGKNYPDAQKMIDRLRYARHEMMVVQTIDPSEMSPGDVGEFMLHDREGGQTRRITIDQREKERFRQRVNDYQKKLQRFCRSKQITLLTAETHQSAIDILSVALREQAMISA
ncbi:MAG: DUF58 domain-containing protein [Opitutales bacterium]|nr:DUF58 domain-containing protein [Opitutales bacterium]